MGFFDRVYNLARGGVKTLLRPGDPAREAALDAELARERPRVVGREEGTSPPLESNAPSASAPQRTPPERDASGEIKRTL